MSERNFGSDAETSIASVANVVLRYRGEETIKGIPQQYSRGYLCRLRSLFCNNRDDTILQPNWCVEEASLDFGLLQLCVTMIMIEESKEGSEKRRGAKRCYLG